MKDYQVLWHEGKEIPLPAREPYGHRSDAYEVILEGQTEPSKLTGYYWFPYNSWVYAGTQVPIKVKTWIEKIWR